MNTAVARVIRGTAVAFIASMFSACALHFPDHCKALCDTRPEQKRLLGCFEKHHVPVPSMKEDMTYFTPKHNPAGPPILLLHELPALSPDVLRLALRLADAGYAVYVPVLWGNEHENASSTGILVKYSVELSYSRRWEGHKSDADRPILGDLIAFYHDVIQPRHHRQPAAVIGNCATGIFAFALAANIPEVVAPVASQPAMPFKLFIPQEEATGLSEKDTQRLKVRCETPAFQMLGFRFQEDRVSASRRFAKLRQEFGDHFIDGTVPLTLYYGRDRLPLRAHSVLTGCFEENQAPSTMHAWTECLGFLRAKLGPGGPRLYRFNPYPTQDYPGTLKRK